MAVQLDDFKTRQRAMWAAGDYATLSEHVTDIGVRVVERVGVAPGSDVLDVACGAGNAAIPAAQAGADVTGLDLVPELLAAGADRAAKTGVEITWVEGDAEALPFEEGSFDRVFSTIGHMFAPRHRQTADEMARVCRKGGVIGICCWTPEGSVGEVFRSVGSYMPPPPEYASPPVLWGTEEHVRAMFPSAGTFEFERHSATVAWESAEGFADYFLNRFGPLIAAKEMLGDRFGELRAEILETWARWNEASDGSFRLPQEYLLSVIRV
jgi:ubiquinone/menaquinone biosynthesis C-methylase UbiE